MGLGIGLDGCLYVGAFRSRILINDLNAKHIDSSSTDYRNIVNVGRDMIISRTKCRRGPHLLTTSPDFEMI